MPAGASSWSTEQLTGFLAAIARAEDEASAVSAAVERAAEALECEIGVLVRGAVIEASVGFPAGGAPTQEVLDAVAGRRRELAIPGYGSAATISAPLEDQGCRSLLVARVGVPFQPEEEIVLGGMARILGLTLTTIRAMDTLRERQRLLELSSAIQRAITLRAPLPEVLTMIADGAAELLGDEVVGLKIVDEDDPTSLRTVASHGVPDDVGAMIEVVPVGSGVAGRAIVEGRLVVEETYRTMPGALVPFVERGLEAAMAAPIHDGDNVIGGLVVASYTPGRTYSRSEQEMLVAFAQHASLALLDARSVDELLRQALRDPLTSLANRTLFLDRLEHALARAERESSAVGVLFLDLDRFKGVNDSLGHAAGDGLLVQVGERLRALTRSTDTIARFGGDEFAVLTEDVHEQSVVAKLAAKIADGLRQPFTVDGDEIRLSASIGIALAHRVGDQPLREADHAMYRAKAEGKDRYEFFEHGMRAAMLDRLELEVDLKRAVEHGGFLLHYQPIVELATGAIVGVEGLIRWSHPERGLLPPAAFIPIAEETGAIVAIGRWVLHEACTRAAAWQAELPPASRPYISVNLAPVQLRQPGLVEEVADVLVDTGLDPSLLVLEITETSLLDDRRAIQRLRALQELGLRLAVDDFGTGYSSLHYLKEFAIDALKIPKSFIDQLESGSGDAALAQAIIELGRTFELEVVAEGIERPDQLTQLRALGCLYGQGDLFAPADGVEWIEALLRAPERSLSPRAPAAARSFVR